MDILYTRMYTYMYHIGVATQRRPLRAVPRLQESCIQEGQKVSPKLRKNGCTVMACGPVGAIVSRGWGDANWHAFVQAVGWPKGFFVARPAAGVVSHRGPRFYCAKGQRWRSNLTTCKVGRARTGGFRGGQSPKKTLGVAVPLRLGRRQQGDFPNISV
jgi:hypothetical protein